MVIWTFDYTATQRDGMPNGKICEQTMFCPTDVVRDTVVESAGVALNVEHGIVWNDTTRQAEKWWIYDRSQNLFQGSLLVLILDLRKNNFSFRLGLLKRGDIKPIH
jgi:hypothetical protein